MTGHGGILSRSAVQIWHPASFREERNIFMIKVVAYQGESIDSLILRYRRTRGKSGIPKEIQRRQAFMKPGERRRKKHAEAIRMRERAKRRSHRKTNHS